MSIYRYANVSAHARIYVTRSRGVKMAAHSRTMMEALSGSSSENF